MYSPCPFVRTAIRCRAWADSFRPLQPWMTDSRFRARSAWRTSTPGRLRPPNRSPVCSWYALVEFRSFRAKRTQRKRGTQHSTFWTKMATVWRNAVGSEVSRIFGQWWRNVRTGSAIADYVMANTAPRRLTIEKCCSNIRKSKSTLWIKWATVWRNAVGSKEATTSAKCSDCLTNCRLPTT